MKSLTFCMVDCTAGDNKEMYTQTSYEVKAAAVVAAPTRRQRYHRQPLKNLYMKKHTQIINTHIERTS